MIYYGETPSNLKTPTRVSSSKGTISLKLPFYRKVDIDLNNIESSYRAKLVPLEGRVMIESTPNDATVFLNDNRIENLTTPMSIKVPMDRESTVLLRKQDYREAQEVIRWDDEKNNIQQLTINLKPE